MRKLPDMRKLYDMHKGLPHMRKSLPDICVSYMMSVYMMSVFSFAPGAR